MTPILEAAGVTVHYGRARAGECPALDAVDLQVRAGESVGIVGESGSGKSTLAKAFIGLIPVTTGEIRMRGTPIAGRRTREQVRQLQMVFQDPSSSLNPRLPIGSMLEELIRFHRLASGSGVTARARQLLDMVGLPASTYHALPRRLSGGQRQRVGIARALAVDPDILIADESTAALDVSVQAAILNLLMQLKRELGLTLLFISHDLAVVQHISERVVVMKGGVLIEDRPAAELFTTPEQEYTRQLLAAVPRL